MSALAAKLTWMIYIAALGYWGRCVRSRMYPNFLAERLDEIKELKPRVNIRPRCES